MPSRGSDDRKSSTGRSPSSRKCTVLATTILFVLALGATCSSLLYFELLRHEHLKEELEVPLDLVLNPQGVGEKEAKARRRRATEADAVKGLALCDDCVPKRIHHTYKTDVLPPGYAELRERCKAVYPDYEFFLWTDASARKMIGERYGAAHVANFDSYSTHNIQRADALRYYVLHAYGGFYADLNTACVPGHRWDSLRAVPAGLCGTAPFGVTNDFMVAAQGHPFYGFLIDRLAAFNRWYGFPYLTVLLSTGPLFVTFSIGAYAPDRAVTPHMAEVAPLEPPSDPPISSSPYAPAALRGGGSSGGPLRNASGLAEHVWPRLLPPVLCGGWPDSVIAYPLVMTGSWHSWDVALVRWLAAWWWSLLILLAAVASCVTVTTGAHRGRKPTGASDARSIVGCAESFRRAYSLVLGKKSSREKE
jgi:mannosyltransferase OCH1-like enzyme